MHVLVTYNKVRIKNNREKVETSFSPFQVNWGFLLPWKPEFWSNLSQNLMQPFPQPSDATHKILSRLTNWLQRYSSLKVWTTDFNLILWAFSLGELKNTSSPKGNDRSPESNVPSQISFKTSMETSLSHYNCLEYFSNTQGPLIPQ